MLWERALNSHRKTMFSANVRGYVKRIWTHLWPTDRPRGDLAKLLHRTPFHVHVHECNQTLNWRRKTHDIGWLWGKVVSIRISMFWVWESMCICVNACVYMNMYVYVFGCGFDGTKGTMVFLYLEVKPMCKTSNKILIKTKIFLKKVRKRKSMMIN